MSIQVNYASSRPTLYGLGRKMLAAIITYSKPGTERLDFKRTDEASFTADFSLATGAEDTYQADRVAISKAIGARNTSEVKADKFINRCKDLISDEPEFGPRWNINWIELGFKTPGTIETPSDVDGKLEVLRSLGGFYAENAALEVAQIKVTSARAVELEKELSDAVNLITARDTAAQFSLQARDRDEETFKKRIRAVIDELDFLLDPMDARWTAFGLNQPGETERPEQPQNVQAGSPAPRVLALTWEPAARASRYKVRTQVAGRDQGFETVAEVFDAHAELTFEPGQLVKVEIVAVNGAGESAPSGVVELTIAGQKAAA